MQKPRLKALTALLLLTLTLATLPLVNASTGYILINTITAPSTPGQTVTAGGNVNLYFGGVTWSGGQFYLLMSRDGFSQITSSPPDQRYTPTFDVATLTAPAETTISGTTEYPGSWKVGYNWVNGSIKLDVPGGNYFIKAFDGTATAVAVTDTYITITPTLSVTPTYGAPNTTLTITGYGFIETAPRNLVNLSYYNPVTATWVKIQDLIAVDAIGKFTWTMNAPDLMQVMPTGLNWISGYIITFRATINYTGASYNADYTEYSRGLSRVATQTAPSGQMWGNNTDFSATVILPVGGSLRITGNRFFATDTVAFLWDGVQIDTAKTNGTGYFDKTFTVPVTTLGPHTVTIRDANNVVFTITVAVSTTLLLSPTSGPVETVVTVTGYGYPASGVPTGTVYNVTIRWYGYVTRNVAWALTDASGYFTTTFTVPNDFGGAHTVAGIANDTSATSASATFTVTPQLVVSTTLTKPYNSTFSSDASLRVYAIGTGFDPSIVGYAPNIDNTMLGVNPLASTWQTVVPANATGNIIITFAGGYFAPGVHSFSLYGVGTTMPIAPAAVATFTILTTGDPVAGTITAMNTTLVTSLSAQNATLLAINGTIAIINTNVGTVQASLSAINATVVAINGTVATIRTDVGVIRANVTTIMPTITTISSGVATISTSVGTIQTSLSSIDGRISGVSGSVATLSTSIGTVQTDIAAIKPKVTSIDDKVATIQTDVGTLTGKVTSIDGKVATIQTDVGTLKLDISDLQESINNIPGQVSIPIWIAVILALIAAIAAIITLIQIRRKIAG